MILMQLLLPLYDRDGRSNPPEYFSELKEEFTNRFGGVTMYSRSPVVGLWKESEEKTVKDEFVIYEVLCESVERTYWRDKKAFLEEKFGQDEIVIRHWEVMLV